MGEFKVRAVPAEEEKSVAEKEQDLLKKHEESEKQESKSDEKEDLQKEKVGKPQIKDEDVLSHLKEKYGIEADSLDKITKPRPLDEVEYPEDVKGYLQYHKDTGRSLNDYLQTQRDFSEVPDDQILRDYLKAENKGLDDDDIDYLLEQEFDYDEDDDDAKSKEINRKKKIVEAREYFESQKQKYMEPIESKGDRVPGQGDGKKPNNEQSNEDGEADKRYEKFQSETQKLFNEKFEGFEFDLGDGAKAVFNPGEASKIAEAQSDLNNFVSKFVDPKTGEVKDVSGYHRALSAAMNADKMAKFFYEKGKADAIKADAEKSKRPPAGLNKIPSAVSSSSSVKVKAVNHNPKGLKMK